MAPRLRAERDKCIGAGQCFVAAENLELADDGKIVILNGGVVTEDQLADVESAVDMCPAEVLELVEADQSDETKDEGPSR